MRMQFIFLATFAALLGFDPSAVEARDCCLLKPCRGCNVCCSSLASATKREPDNDADTAVANFRKKLAKARTVDRSVAVRANDDWAKLDELTRDLRRYTVTPVANRGGERSPQVSSERELNLGHLKEGLTVLSTALKANPEASLVLGLIGDLLPLIDDVLKPSSSAASGSGAGSALNPDGPGTASAGAGSSSPPKSMTPAELTQSLKKLATLMDEITEKVHADQKKAAKLAAEATEQAAAAKKTQDAETVALKEQLQKTAKALQDAADAVQGGAESAPKPEPAPKPE